VALAPTVVVSGLCAGRRYLLLRFDSPGAVPADGDFAAAAAAAAQRYEFVAGGAAHRLAEPNPFMSDGAVFYRCVCCGADDGQDGDG